MTLVFAVVTALFFGSTAFAQEDTSGLMGRTHNVSLRLSNTNTEVEDIDTSTTELEMSYGKNFGQIMPFVQISYLTSGSDGADSNTKSLDFGLQAFLLANEPGNDLIPYAQISLSMVSSTVESGASEIDIKGNPITFGVGVLWYPFGEIFALSATLLRMQGELEASSGDLESDLDTSGTAIGVGYVISFY